MSAVDAGLAILGGLVKAFTNPQVDAVIDVVVEALQGVDDIAKNAADGDWSAEDATALKAVLAESFAAVPGLGEERAGALAGGLTAGLSLLIEAALERRKEGPRKPVRKVGAFFAEHKARRQTDSPDQQYRLLGACPFNSGANAGIWALLCGTPWTRTQLLQAVQDLVAAGAIDSIRRPETICRDFLGRVQEKGRLQRL